MGGETFFSRKRGAPPGYGGKRGVFLFSFFFFPFFRFCLGFAFFPKNLRGLPPPPGAFFFFFWGGRGGPPCFSPRLGEKPRGGESGTRGKKFTGFFRGRGPGGRWGGPPKIPVFFFLFFFPGVISFGNFLEGGPTLGKRGAWPFWEKKRLLPKFSWGLKKRGGFFFFFFFRGGPPAPLGKRGGGGKTKTFFFFFFFKKVFPHPIFQIFGKVGPGGLGGRGGSFFFLIFFQKKISGGNSGAGKGLFFFFLGFLGGFTGFVGFFFFFFPRPQVWKGKKGGKKFFRFFSLGDFPPKGGGKLKKNPQ